MPLNSPQKTNLEEQANAVWVLGANGEVAGVLLNELVVALGQGGSLVDAANPLPVGGTVQIQGLEGANDSFQYPRLDPSTLTMQTIEYEHHEIHGGSSYIASATDADLDTAQELVIAFTTPNTLKWLHMLAYASNTSAGTWEVLEGPTITLDTGADMPVFNHNRNSAKTSGVLTIETVPEVGEMTLNPTITNDGTVLLTELIGAGREKVGGESRSNNEWVLRGNTTYAFRITGNANDGRATIKLTWYEHTDKVT